MYETIIVDTDIWQKPYLKDIYSQLLVLSEPRIRKCDSFSSVQQSSAEYYLKADFDSHDEYVQFFGNVRNKMSELIRAIASEQVCLTQTT
jgi:hypothetical protein